MSSTMIGALGAVFSVVLMLGLWVGEAQERGSRVAGDWWSPAALGLLRAEVVVVRGLLILLVTRSAAWAAGPGLVVLAGWAGVSRFVRVARPESWPRRRWGWLAAGVVLAGAWLLLVGVFLPVPGPVALGRPGGGGASPGRGGRAPGLAPSHLTPIVPVICDRNPCNKIRGDRL